MDAKTDIQARTFWDKTWNRFLKHQGMIAPSSKLVQHMIPHVPRHGRILDLGCGEGRNCLYLNRVGFSCTGLDFSASAVRVLANNLFDEEVKGQCTVGDACRLPFPRETFDGVLAHHIFDHLDGEGFACALRETYRVLKAGGVLLATMDTLHPEATEKNVVVMDDQTLVFVKGPQKGMRFRPYIETELQKFPEMGWSFLKNDLTPRRSKIMLLRKQVPQG